MSNPIIKAIGKHLAMGRFVVEVRFVSHKQPQEFVCVLDDNSEEKHLIENTDHDKYVKIFKEAIDYWKRVHWSN